ncbi:MAG: hypothetical protein K2Y18_09055 [Alphaproteobacteria bacterium]|jgi:hypothetical protein|nr:hypothetical protein [Alphaproteobacteria bacterium]
MKIKSLIKCAVIVSCVINFAETAWGSSEETKEASEVAAGALSPVSQVKSIDPEFQDLSSLEAKDLGSEYKGKLIALQQTPPPAIEELRPDLKGTDVLLLIEACQTKNIDPFVAFVKSNAKQKVKTWLQSLIVKPETNYERYLDSGVIFDAESVHAKTSSKLESTGEFFGALNRYLDTLTTAKLCEYCPFSVPVIQQDATHVLQILVSVDEKVKLALREALGVWVDHFKVSANTDFLNSNISYGKSGQPKSRKKEDFKKALQAVIR